jgi:hypothetical protein
MNPYLPPESSTTSLQSETGSKAETFRKHFGNESEADRKRFGSANSAFSRRKPTNLVSAARKKFATNRHTHQQATWRARISLRGGPLETRRVRKRALLKTSHPHGRSLAYASGFQQHATDRTLKTLTAFLTQFEPPIPLFLEQDHVFRPISVSNSPHQKTLTE